MKIKEKRIDDDDKNLHNGHRKRAREILSKTSIENLPPHNVLELMLFNVIPRGDVNPLAHRLINEFGGFSEVLNASVEELRAIRGVGPRTADYLSTFVEFMQFYFFDKLKERPQIRNTSEAIAFLGELFKSLTKEHIYVICLDSSKRIKHVQCIADGDSVSINIRVKDIVKIAEKQKSGDVILAHNHPEAKCLPSPADDRLTKAVITSFSLHKIKLLDHFIFGIDGVFSYRDAGVLETYYTQAQKFVHGESTPNALKGAGGEIKVLPKFDVIAGAKNANSKPNE